MMGPCGGEKGTLVNDSQVALCVRIRLGSTVEAGLFALKELGGDGTDRRGDEPLAR